MNDHEKDAAPYLTGTILTPGEDVYELSRRCPRCHESLYVGSLMPKRICLACGFYLRLASFNPEIPESRNGLLEKIKSGKITTSII